MVSKLISCICLVCFLAACSGPRHATHSPRKPSSPPVYRPATPPKKSNPARSPIPGSARHTVYRDQVVRTAREFLGSRYQYGGTGKPGFDCSGYTSTVFREAGLSIPRTSRDQSVFGPKRKASQANPGDLIFFGRGSVDHVGIVLENKGSQMLVIHSTKSGGVRIDDVMAIDYWNSRILWVIDPYQELMSVGSR